jgi:MFS family permease
MDDAARPFLGEYTKSTQVRELSLQTLGCLFSVSFANGYAKAVAESLVLPYLLILNIPFRQSSMFFVVQPAVSLLIWMPISLASDRLQFRYGRRKPFLVGLMLLSLAGYVIMGLGNSFARSGLWHNETVALWFFVGTGMAAVCHDISSIFVRVLANDICPDPQRQSVNSYITTGMFSGQLLGRLLASVPLAKLIVLPPSWVGADFIVAFWTVPVVFVFFSVAVFGIREPRLAVEEEEDTISDIIATDLKRSYRHEEPEKDCCTMLCGPPSKPEFSYRLAFLMPANFWAVWNSTLFGFMLSFCYLFFWTSFVATTLYQTAGGDPSFEVGVDFGIHSAMLMNLAAVVVASQLHKINAAFGTEEVFFGAQLIGALSLSSIFWVQAKVFVILLSVCYGMVSAVFTNNALLVSEGVPLHINKSERHRVRAFLVGLLQSSRFLAQIVMAVVSAFLVPSRHVDFRLVIIVPSVTSVLVQFASTVYFCSTKSPKYKDGPSFYSPALAD